MILLLLACSAEPSPFAGVLRVVDRDGDGAVSEPEYRAVALHAPPFSAVDLDADGAISGQEIETLTLATNPSRFDPSLRMKPGSKGAGKRRDQDGRSLGPRDIVKLEALRFVVAEIASKTPDAVVPSEEELRTVVDGGLNSVEGRALRGRLAEAAEAAGLTLPDELTP